MPTRSIRFRLTLWYAVILTAALALFSGLIWLSLRHQLLADIDQDLAGRADRLESYFRVESAGPNVADELEEFCQAFAPGSYVRMQGSNGFVFEYPPNQRAGLQETRTLRKEFTSNGSRFAMEIGAPTGDVTHVLRLLRLLLVGLLPLIILVACAGGAWLSRRALSPVQDVAAAALLISIENLAGRVPVPKTGDEIAHLAEVLNSVLARLEVAVRTLSQFVADASHELRTPLAVIRTTAELALRRERTPESYQDSLASITAGTKRMTGLIEDLLKSARSGNGAAEMPRDPIDLHDILRDVCGEIAPLASARNICVNHLAGQEAAVISGNRPALYRLLLVLLDNALKFSPSNGEVIARVERSGAAVHLVVQDFGCGIKAVDIQHIFERFFQAEGSQSAEGGHGLGLPLAQDIARAHGATIEVISSEGKGSTFRVVFPPRGQDLEPLDSAALAGALSRR